MSQTLQALNSIIKYKTERQRQKIDESLAMLDMGRKLKQQQIDANYQKEMMDFRRNQERRDKRKEERDISASQLAMDLSKIEQEKQQIELNAMKIASDNASIQKEKEQQDKLKIIQLEKAKMQLESLKEQERENIREGMIANSENKFNLKSESLFNQLQMERIIPSVVFSKASDSAITKDFDLSELRTKIYNAVDGDQKKYLETLIGKDTAYGDGLLTGIMSLELQKSKSGIPNNKYLVDVLNNLAGSIVNNKNFIEQARKNNISFQKAKNIFFSLQQLKSEKKTEDQEFQTASFQELIDKTVNIRINKKLDNILMRQAREQNMDYNNQDIIFTDDEKQDLIDAGFSESDIE
jgi:hypothetical protein